MLCSNCDTAEASSLCKECDDFFCKECSTIHLKVKQYKTHHFEPCQKRTTVCVNCDSALAQHVCLDCKPTEKDFCSECSVIHTKVKKFRGHRIISSTELPVTSDDNVNLRTYCSKATKKYAIDTILFSLEKQLSLWFEDVFEADSFTDYKFWSSLLSGTSSMFIFYGLSKILLGQYTTVFHIVLGGFILTRLRQSQPRLKHEIVPPPLFPSTTPNLSSVKQLRKDFTLENFPDDSNGNGNGCQQYSSMAYSSRVGSSSISRRDSNGLNNNARNDGFSGLGTSTARPNDATDSEFKDEFWYPLQGKLASFRSRGVRAYKPKQKRNKNPEPEAELYSYGDN